MARNDNKTTFTNEPVAEFLDRVEPAQRRNDAEELITIFEEETGERAEMWGPSIIGFGRYHYVYESGREGDAPAAAFSPRKAQMVVYLIGGYEAEYPEELAKLGPYKTGNACLYFKKLSDLDEQILRFLIRDSYQRTKAEYPEA